MNRRLLLAVVTTTGLVGALGAVGAAGAATSGPDDRLASLARVNGMSPAQVDRVLRTDSSARISSSGRLVFRDHLDRSRPDAAATRAPYPLDQTFALHSRPGSSRTIYIDFDGYTVTGSSQWVADGLAPKSYSGFSLDSDTATFNDSERTEIQTVWQRVAEDYAPFDVDVTTEQPADAAIDRSGPGDTVYGTVAAVTGSKEAHASSATCGGEQGCTGIAYTDVFGVTRNHQDYQPAWIFSAYLPDTFNIAESVSHEVGHNFGLAHDGETGGDDYSAGQGIWAPIMGSGVKPLIQWSDGDYRGANNQQNDLAIIAENAPIVPDEAGSSVGTASATLPTPSTPAVIAQRSDVDVFALGECSGSVSVSATPAPVSPDLDIRLSLLDPTGTEVASANPPSARAADNQASGLDASLTYTATGGALYAAVDGVGQGDPQATGYSDYASLGRYSLEVAGCDGSAPTALAPGAPVIGKAQPGARGGKVTASVSWRAPADDGGSAITGYTIYAARLSASGAVLKTLRFQVAPSAAGRPVSLQLTKARWAFSVAAVNDIGVGARSQRSNAVPAR